MAELVQLDHASSDERPWYFKVKFNSEKFKISEDKNGPLIMRCPRSGNIYLGLDQPKGILVQMPCGTKHFIKHE